MRPNNDAGMDREEPTTTHANWGEGDPTLIVSSTAARLTRPIVEDHLLIGSSAQCGLRLPDIDAVHAEILHDVRDDYVLTLRGPGEMNANPETAGARPGERSEILRTGAQFTAGPWRFVFTREEFADHGRPFGGRQGGEFSDQPPQPERPDYAGDGRSPRRLEPPID